MPATTMDRGRALLLAALIGLAVMWLTGAIPRWGQWYSEQAYHRAQVHALFDGRLALSHDVASLGLDLAWIDGGVQQVHGLGVPLWLAIWEAIGRAIHLTPFPDRVAMLFGAIGMLYALVRAWMGPGGDRSYASRGAFVFTALLPGVIAMLRGRVVVYEETEAYAYGTAMLLLAGVIMMVRRPSTTRYVLLLAFAGATGLVRPTVWFYGAAAAAIATVLYVRHRGSLGAALRPVAVAWGLFAAGGAALYATNALRFGDGAEFGHRVNLGNLYVTRFASAYDDVPALTAAKELAGAMFAHPELAAHRELWDARIHAGQASTPRWREYYFTTYTWPYAPLGAAGLVLGAIAWLRPRRRTEPDADAPAAPRAPAPGPDLARDTRWLTLWAVLGGAPLVGFYLHSPAMSSRYLLDLGPAIAVLVATVWRHAAVALGRRGLGGLAFAGFIAWWAVSALGFRTHRAYLPPVGRTAAYASTMKLVAPLPGVALVPEAYDVADPWLAGYLGADAWSCRCYVDPWREAACDHAGLPNGETAALLRADRPRMLERRIDGEATAWFAPPALYENGTTWDPETGAVGPATYLFADDPAYVDVEVAPRGRPAGGDWLPAVRAKVEREELRLLWSASTARGVRLRFAGPRTARDRHGLQVIFLAFGPPDRVDRPTSGYLLLRMAWRDHPVRP